MMEDADPAPAPAWLLALLEAPAPAAAHNDHEDDDELDSDSDDDTSEDETESESDDDTAGADKVGMRIMQDHDLMRWALRTIVCRPNFDTAIETPTTIRLYLCEQFHIDPSSFTKEHRSRMEDILVSITKQVEKEKVLDPFCNEAMIMLLERHNLPSRQRDNTIVRFAKQFINNVEKDDDDLDNNIWLEYDEDDVDNFEAETDFLKPVDKEYVCEEAITILLSRLNFPDFMGLYDGNMVRFAKKFIRNVKDDIYKTFTDMRTEEEGYKGLDSERDMGHEVEAAIRCCPEVLSRFSERFGLYPIKCLTIMRSHNPAERLFCNTKAVAFVPLFARLAIEFNVFEEEERGGLVWNNRRRNLLQCLVEHSDSSPRRQIDEQQQERLDTTLLAVLTQLRQLGYFVKDDIQEYDFVHGLCQTERLYFAQHRFRFLIGWDPSSLLQTEGDNSGTLPIHYVANNLQAFQVVLDSLFRYYPRWKGINTLFQKDNDGDTPFQLACKSLSRTKVMEVVEEVLVRHTTTNGLVNDNTGNAMILAATDDRISLDGLFFLIQRQPNSMLRMLRHRNNNNNNNNNRINTNNTGNTNHVDNGSNDNHNNSILRGSARKRKRN